MPRLTSCPKLIITSGTYLHATRTLPGSTYMPNTRGSLITHVKFQLPSADATFLDVMAGFDMLVPVPYRYRTRIVSSPDGWCYWNMPILLSLFFLLYTCTFHRMMR